MKCIQVGIQGASGAFRPCLRLHSGCIQVAFRKVMIPHSPPLRGVGVIECGQSRGVGDLFSR